MNDLFLFVRPPRPLWPFNGPHSAFWPPLAFASLAASLRQELPDLRVQILDAPVLQMGWRSVERELSARSPTYVGIGEEAVSCVEGLRLARLARQGGARVIAGGCFFGLAAAEALSSGLIDVVVRGEGEVTIVELVRALRQGSALDLRRVRGIAFRDGDELVVTPARPLIRDLDALPWPAYDLLPVDRYGAGSRNHPHLAAIELGRGCHGSCGFCVLWRQMGRFVGERTVPHYRAKSVERLMEEVRWLVRTQGRRYLGWVDPCFNADPHVPGEMAERLLQENLRVGQSAWVRSDALVRDAESGALDACVRAGLNEVVLGIERPDDPSTLALGKTCRVQHSREALRVLRKRHPSVFAIGSFIYGIPGDTPAIMRKIVDFAVGLGLDQSFFVPLTPLPGTDGWRPELWDSTGERFREYSFLPAGRVGVPQADLERALRRSLLFHWTAARFALCARSLLGRDPRRRRVTWRLFWRGAWFQVGRELRRLFGGEEDFGMVFPKWYET